MYGMSFCPCCVCMVGLVDAVCMVLCVGAI